MGLTTGSLRSKSITHLWQLGYGAVTSESLVAWHNLMGSRGLLLTVLVANSPQVLLSFLFLTYNGLYTCMLLADEWNGYVCILPKLFPILPHSNTIMMGWCSIL